MNATARESTDPLEPLLDAADRSRVLQAVRKLQHNLAELLTGREEFTIKLEIHGHQQKLIHVRVTTDAFDRPEGVPAGQRGHRR